MKLTPCGLPVNVSVDVENGPKHHPQAPSWTGKAPPMKNPVRTLLPDPTVKPSLNLLYGPPLEVAPEHIKCEFCKKYLHACCVQDFLDSAREELKAYFGDYDYSIVRIPRAPWSGRYEIHASYSLRGERRYFVDGRGPTPWKALLSVNQMEQFLRKLAILA